MQGAKGDTGQQGPRGFNGEKGEFGLRGEKGDKGDAGTTSANVDLTRGKKEQTITLIDTKTGDSTTFVLRQ